MHLPLKNANRTMNLMTKTVAKTIPPLYSQESKGQDAIVKVKFFLGSWRWYATEMNPETGLCFGKVVSDMCPDGELGYFDLMELASTKVRPGIAVERDKWFKPTPLKDCK